MALGKYRFIPKGRYFPPHTDLKFETDVRRERNITLFFIILCVLIALGLPMLANLGKSIFGIEPIIY